MIADPDLAPTSAAPKAASPASRPPEPEHVDLDDRRPRRWGWALVVVGFGGFLAWALSAPLDAGVSAPGTVVVTGNRKAVQPVAGGKIAAILAKDGDEVAAGKVLVRLDDTQSRSQYDISMGQWLTGLATEARLVAERSGAPAPAYPKALLDAKGDPRAAEAMVLQSQLFATRRAALASELSAMRESLRGLEMQVAGIEASRRAREEELRLLRGQLDALRPVADDGFVPRARVVEQERAVAALTAAIAEDTGNLGRQRQAIAEIRARMAGREQEARKEAESQLADVQRDLASLRSRLDGLRFDLVNTEILAPTDGVVMGLSVHTVGGVVAAGSPMMEIVPRDEPLQIEAQVAPHLIDKVRPGLSVDILFPAFEQATTPRIEGTVVGVSADVLVEPKQGIPYYKALVQVTAVGRAGMKTHEVRAGMPAEVFFRTGERTAMNYLLKPLTDRVRRGLTEP